MASGRPFPLNAWYPAAWSREVQPALVQRTVCGQDVVLYRRPNGGVAALEDACWHRLLPLSMGRLVGDEVVCGYHGLVFNASGRCTHMPAQKTINPAACVRSYPVVERHRLVWIWPGDPALADPADLPDFHWNDGAEWKGEGGTFYSLKCDWRLVVDNLMDLTHETYVHSGSIGHDAILDTPFEVTHTDRAATMTRWMIDIDAPPFWGGLLGQPGRVDRWQIVTFQSPAVVVGDVGVAPTGTGAPQGNRSQGVNGAFLAAIAPRPRRAAIISGTSSALSARTTKSLPRAFGAPMSTRGGGCTTRTTSSSRRSSAQSTVIRARPSTTSTSMPARCGRGA